MGDTIEYSLGYPKKLHLQKKLKLEEFARHDLIPNILPSTPDQVLSLKFESTICNLGHTMTPSSVVNPPTIVDWEAEPQSLYTLIMFDPDAPSRFDPIYRSVVHWLIINIPGNTWDKGETLAEYIGAGPAKDTGFHRYIVVVFKQLNRQIADMNIGHLPNDSGVGRRNFDLQKFVKTHGLSHPIAANFFQAKWDDAVVLPAEKAIKEKQSGSHVRIRTLSIDAAEDTQ